MARKNGADTLGWVRFPVTFTGIGALILLALTGWYWCESNAKDTLLFFLLGLTALGTVSAAFYTARILVCTLDKSARDAEAERSQLERQDNYDALELKRSSFRYAERWNDPRMFYARKTLRELADAHSQSEEEAKAYISKNETNIIHILNFLEEICSAYKHGIVDPDITKAQFDFVIVMTWKIVAPWVNEYRRNRNDDIWDGLQATARAWKSA